MKSVENCIECNAQPRMGLNKTVMSTCTEWILSDCVLHKESKASISKDDLEWARNWISGKVLVVVTLVEPLRGSVTNLFSFPRISCGAIQIESLQDSKAIEWRFFYQNGFLQHWPSSLFKLNPFALGLITHSIYYVALNLRDLRAFQSAQSAGKNTFRRWRWSKGTQMMLIINADQ